MPNFWWPIIKRYYKKIPKNPLRKFIWILKSIEFHLHERNSTTVIKLLVSLGPSAWDIGSDIRQGQTFLEGDTYIKIVTDRNASSITDECTLLEITGNWKFVTKGFENSNGITQPESTQVIQNIGFPVEMVGLCTKILGFENADVTKFRFACKEKDPIWGWLVLSFIFILPGLYTLVCSKNPNYGYLVRTMPNCPKYLLFLLSIILIPFFPLQVFFIKTLALLTNGEELKKISCFLTKQEGVSESMFQFILQLIIIFSRADRLPSTTQLVVLSSSLIFMAKSRVEGNFANEPDASLLKMIKSLPRCLCLVLYLSGSIAILASILKTFFLLFTLIFWGLFFLPGSWCIFCLKAKKCVSIKEIAG